MITQQQQPRSKHSLAHINTPAAISSFRNINRAIFPVVYNEAFYRKVLHGDPRLACVVSIAHEVVGKLLFCRNTRFMTKITSSISIPEVINEC